MNTRFATMLVAAATAAVFATGCPMSDGTGDEEQGEMTSTGSGSGGTTTTTSTAASVTVVNQSWTSIYHIYIADCASTTWGPDLLGSDVMAVGHQGTVGVTPGCRDFLAESSDGYQWQTRYQVLAGQNLTWTLR